MKGLRRRDIAVMVIVFSAAVWLAGMMRSFLLSEIAERLLPHVISQAAESSDGNEAQLSLKAGDTVLRIQQTAHLPTGASELSGKTINRCSVT